MISPVIDDDDDDDDDGDGDDNNDKMLGMHVVMLLWQSI